MAKPRVLLLNPPGKRVYLRDYYCSKASQADYVNAPIDLIWASGWLREHAGLVLIDAIADSLSQRQCLRQIVQTDPDMVFGLIGSASYSEDVDFYSRLAGTIQAPIVLSGDCLQEGVRGQLKSLPWASAFLHDLTTSALADFLRGCRDPQGLPGMTLRVGEKVHAGRSGAGAGGQFSLPPPDHTLFLCRQYRNPFVRRSPFATVLTDYGCPYRCNFCVMPSLGWRMRRLDGVLEEIRQLQSLGVKELFFLDQTFGLNRPRCRRLLQVLTDGGSGWVCFNRPDLVDANWAEELAAAGCHTMILGLESGSETILKSAQKDYSPARIAEGFDHCRRARIRTVATVILGLPEESEQTLQQTLKFLHEVGPDFASFNVAVPRAATPLRQRAIRLGLIQAEAQDLDQSGQPVSMPSLYLRRSQIAGLRRDALRSFYLRPRYLARRTAALLKERSLRQWYNQVRQGLALLRNMVA